MGTAADNLLDGVMTAAEDGQPTDDRIILSINESTRTINYDGALILGVKGDRFAERIYFRCPQYVYKDQNEVIDLTLETTKIYINYKNAFNEPYIEECSKHGLENDIYMFSWFVSDFVTAKEGNVSFNVCVKDESETIKDSEGNIIVQEWHTTAFKEGIILPAVDVSSKTPEVITSDTVTSAEIISEYDRLTTQLSDVNDYIDGQVNNQMDETLNQYIISMTADYHYTTFNTDFDFSTIDMDNVEKYKCVINFSSINYVLDMVHHYIPANGYYVFRFSNGEMGVEVVHEVSTNDVTIHRYNTTSDIAKTFNQTTVNHNTTYYNEDYPILSSNDIEPVATDNTTAFGAIRSTLVTVNPKEGSIKADKFVEGGTNLEDKYAVNPKRPSFYRRYTFTHLGNYEVFKNVRFIRFKCKYSARNHGGYEEEYSYCLPVTVSYREYYQSKRVVLHAKVDDYSSAMSINNLNTDISFSINIVLEEYVDGSETQKGAYVILWDNGYGDECNVPILITSYTDHKDDIQFSYYDSQSNGLLESLYGMDVELVESGTLV